MMTGEEEQKERWKGRLIDREGFNFYDVSGGKVDLVLVVQRLTLLL